MGFFNVTVDYDRFVRQSEGEVILDLVNTKQLIRGEINRHANQNGTARIMGTALLRDWFQRYFREMDTVDVDLSSKDVIRLGKNLE
jgi:hypothetical protein